MRPEPNNDIDLLLRQLTRRNGAPVSEFDEQHLDADELNSYVANALPAAARARYTDHLADCSSCRKLVTQLSAAQGPVPSEHRAGVVATSGLKSFLASLFSPLVLRYAVPALGLIIVAAVGFIVLRDRQNRESVASLRAGESNSVTATRPQEQPTLSGGFVDDSKTAPPAVQKAESARTETAPTATTHAEAKAPVTAKKLADSETAAAAEAVTAALAHPLLRRAARSACRRETPVALTVEGGTVVEGVIDAAFADDAGWTVIDFKTDVDLEPRLAEYRAQVRLYVRAVAAATGKPARGVLLRV